MPEIPIVDAHHHLWDPPRMRYGWLEEEDPGERALLGDYSAIRGTYLIEDYLEDIRGADVEMSVHIQALYSGEDPVEETAWLQRIADVYGYPHAIIAYCDLSGRDVGRELDRHCAYPNMRGVRTFTQDLLEQAFQEGVEALAERNLIYELHIQHESMAAAWSLARSHPDTRFVVEHAGIPLRRMEAEWSAWREGMGRLAALPNVWAKISGLGMTDHTWRVDTIKKWVLAVVEDFGPDRAMVGSNWPVDSLYSDYGTFAASYRALLAELSLSEQEAILRRNAIEFYGLSEGREL